MLIHRKGKFILDVAAAAKGKEKTNHLARALAEVAMEPLEISPQLFQCVTFDVDPTEKVLKGRIDIDYPGARQAAEAIATALQPDLPHILALFGRLPQLARSVQADDVIVLDEDEARSLSWLTAAFNPQSRFLA